MMYAYDDSDGVADDLCDNVAVHCFVSVQHDDVFNKLPDTI